MHVAAVCLVSIAIIHGAWGVGGGARVAGGAPVVPSPFATAMLYGYDGVTFWQRCGGVVITAGSMLTSAGCVLSDILMWRWRVRAGSAFAHSGGTVHTVMGMQWHGDFNPITRDSDLALVHVRPSLLESGLASPASIAWPGFVHDGLQVSAIGWGHMSYMGWPSEQLQQALVRVQPQAECRAEYAALGRVVTDNMVCARSADTTPRGHCAGDEGGPLLYYDILVGVYSWGHQCGRAGHSAVSTRVSNYADWILFFAQH